MLDHELLFELLPENGDSISRSALSARLSERLGREFEEAEIDSLIWAASPRVSSDPTTKQVKLASTFQFPQVIDQESDLEPWFERYLLRQTPKEFLPYPPPSLSTIVQNTARTGPATGPYSQPDVCLAAVSLFHYSPTAHFDLFAFELKLESGCGAPAVMQAASYQTFAHYTYVGIFLPEGSAMARHLSAMRERAQENGVGVIRITNPAKDEGYEIVTRADRNSPHPGQTDKFINDRFTEANKAALRKWVRL